MLVMSQRMTHRTKHLKIFRNIIIPIAIDVMYSKYFWHCTISTNLTRFDQISGNHIFPNRRIFPFKVLFGRFPYAFLTAKFSILAWAIKENISTMKTCKFFSALIDLTAMVAQSRAIFSSIATRRNMDKFLLTYQALGCYLYSAKFIFTLSATIFGCIKTIFFNIEKFIAGQTIIKFSSMRFFHATLQG
jgi:hypothetical protein